MKKPTFIPKKIDIKKIEKLPLSEWSLDELILFSQKAYSIDYSLGLEVADEIRRRNHEQNF